MNTRDDNNLDDVVGEAVPEKKRAFLDADYTGVFEMITTSTKKIDSQGNRSTTAVPPQ